MNTPWPEILKLLVTVAQWEALRKKGTWATTRNLRVADVLNTEQTHGRHPWEVLMGQPVFNLRGTGEMKP